MATRTSLPGWVRTGEAQGDLAPGPHVLYALGARTTSGVRSRVTVATQVSSGFFTDMLLYRVIPGFLIQVSKQVSKLFEVV